MGCSQPHVQLANEAGVHCGSTLNHNHELALTHSSMNVDPTMQTIPTKLNEMAKTLHKAGLGPAQIYHCLVDECYKNKNNS
jgi:hypothetical protein